MDKIYFYITALMLTILSALTASGFAFAGEPRIIYGPGLTIRGQTAPVGPGDEDSSGSDEGPVMSVGEYYTAETTRYYGAIVSVDREDSSILIDCLRTGEEAGENYEEIIFNYIAGVPLIDAESGLPVNISELKPGDRVLAWAGNTMTLSLPPIVNLQVLAVGVTADTDSPGYVVVSSLERDGGDGTVHITDAAGHTYDLRDGTEITSFKTRMKVTADDIAAGSRIMIWTDPARIVVF